MNMVKFTRTPLASTTTHGSSLHFRHRAAPAQVSVPLLDFHGARVKETLYVAGGVVTSNGGYVSLGFNIDVTPISNANDCGFGKFTSSGRTCERGAAAEITR